MMDGAINHAAAGAMPASAAEAAAPPRTERRGPEPELGAAPPLSAASDLEAVFDVPVKVQAVLGRARMDVSELIRLVPGTMIELDRRVGEAIDIHVNDRLVARGEVVLLDELLGVTMTEIVKDERA